ncbi:CpaD family pilus assembly protein [Terrihabitans soli]|nr:CpaD family pilus assembly protein [Terrihabitans soli]
MRAPILSLSLLAALTLGVAGCASQRNGDYTSAIPDDHRIRHPINVTRGLSTMDLLPGGGPSGLTDRQVADIQAFAADWQKRGRGKLTIQVPRGADRLTDKQSANAAREIRRIFGINGIPASAVSTVIYQADGPGHLAPVRLEFPVLEAKVPHPCGQWPGDIGYRDPTESNRNRSDWNLGCAVQQNLAAQVEDPEDFIRPRAESSASATRRSTVIGKYGKGEPTVTTYPKETVDTKSD